MLAAPTGAFRRLIAGSPALQAQVTAAMRDPASPVAKDIGGAAT
jgi:hypothetical protein